MPERKRKGVGKRGGKVLPFTNTTPRPNYKGLKHILLICGEFGICILEPAFGVVELRLREVIGLAGCRFLGDADVSLERKRGKGLFIFFSFQWRLLQILKGGEIVGSRVLTPIGINWPQTNTSGLSTTRGGKARGYGGWRRSASKMTA